MKIDYIIIQAGGRGSRLTYLTDNKPKALVPVENLPMLFHLFRKYPDKRFIVISDYKKDVLREYLSAFAGVKYLLIEADGAGTCGGVRQAIKNVPDHSPFMLIWSDLILPGNFEFPAETRNYVGISQTFPCRWSFRDGTFVEEHSEEYGVAGFFIFKDKSVIADIPQSGELVRWLRGRNLQFDVVGLGGTKEFGLISEYEKLETEKCRPFNKMTIIGNEIIKEGIDAQGQKLAVLERKWYEYAAQNDVVNIPKIYTLEPLRMERILGKNIYEYETLPTENKKEILRNLTGALNELHRVASVPADPFSLKEAYFGKTMSRLSKIRDLVPFADQKTITINDRECRNVYFYKYELERKLDEIKCDSFTFIHGDCTFSNMMLKDDSEPIFIDPRGYFGFTELYGDPLYDWAKVYYSIVGNYDRFNLKDFRLKINENNVKLSVKSNGWEALEKDFFQMSGADPYAVRLIHSVIWLSLTTYAWQDYDSICGAFYNGLYYLEDCLQ